MIAAIAVLSLVGWSNGESGWPTGQAAVRPTGGLGGGLITHHLPGGPAGEHLAVIDPVNRVIAVYHVNKEGGELKLASVRQIQWDLQVTSYANEGPLVEEIRAGLERQKY